MHDVVVGGPLCESGDIFTQEAGGFVRTRSLPVAEVGEYLVIECAGAYGFVMGSNYNSKPLAAEVLISNGQPHLIRRRQTFEDLIAGESIPKSAEFAVGKTSRDSRIRDCKGAFGPVKMRPAAFGCLSK